MSVQNSLHIQQRISSEFSNRYRVAEGNFQPHACTILIEESNNAKEIIREELEIILGVNIIFQHVSKDHIDQILKRQSNLKQQTDNRLQNNYYHGNADHFLNDLIAEAKALKSSDIHIEAFEDSCRVRIRVDGVLIQRYLIEKKQYPSLINKIKIASNLDIAEKRLPQDGRIYFQNQNDKFDIRVSIVPTLHGEKIVLRLLNNDATNINLESLGFSQLDLSNYLQALKKPHGIILISGPTGSGKTTTLYATLKLLNSTSKNILTIEDPIEYTLKGINQVQVKDNIGLTFASAIKNFLRQDPDIIMLGEIRDAETANMAIRAALTGHLVLSTIHTNSAWGTVSRLVDMGIPSFLIASTLNTTIAQRLVRLLCSSCKKNEDFDPALYPRKYNPPKKISCHYIATGCNDCYNTGYKSRKDVYEVIPIDEDFFEEVKSANTDISVQLKAKQINTIAENVFELFEIVVFFQFLFVFVINITLKSF